MRLRPRTEVSSGAAGDFARITPEGLRLDDALRLRSAEFWLALGLSDRASRELERLSRAAARHPWALRIQMTVFSALSFS